MAIDNLIERISTVLDAKYTLEDLVRQLLWMLELITNMESTYLTRIEPDGSLQHVLFARNTKTMQIPEGLSVPWGDTLCKRALDEQCSYTCDVPDLWGDSVAARALGITTYASIPVVLSDGSLYGTLCAASSLKRRLTEHSRQVLQLFSQLIAQQIQSEQLLKELKDANTVLATASFTDELTGLANRRAVFDILPRLFARARAESRYILLVFADLDKFKQINDIYGHDIGDEFLCAFSRRLQENLRDGELLGRIGGDEFVVAALGPQDNPSALRAADALYARLSHLLSGQYHLSSCVIDYTGPSIGVLAADPERYTPDSAMNEADALMYLDKKYRKTAEQIQ
ncbi:sensor domain-containing diguanylate cyclase [Citrobacter sp. JGM124]|uniref:sensor domain-containing diguanylate cyclase n=1 Tax=Citrobacter sp. JGM124 TaxID=2799789 RepID=UPI001BA8ACAC|nr:sensor domain-containing diguanylate cyclase [Citrobacter sp. JGM124]MBS0848773.1 sensor domain-containing diguanylate cyclase [Citrobacter sp. JGM124]